MRVSEYSKSMRKQIILTLNIRTMGALPKILFLCNRLGARVEYISAAGGYVTMHLSADKSRSHRFVPQLRRLIDVRSLDQLQDCSLTSSDSLKRSCRNW